MSFVEVFFIGVGLSMDAAAVAMANGMCLKAKKAKYALFMGIAFGFFQMAMPVIGFYTGRLFYTLISGFDHWIALTLLSFIGGKMIHDSFKRDEDESCPTEITFQRLILQAIATSIDALTVGVTFAALGIDIFRSSLIIGLITFVISYVSVFIGCAFGTYLGKKAEFMGGLILIVIGLKTFIEHVFFS